MNIGLCWAGSRGHKNDHNRSIPFALLEPLSRIGGVTWHSLVIGDREDEIAEATWIARAGDRFPTFLHSARFVGTLDLVITVDTAVAHLAGSMLVPCWVMLPIAPDFRWQLNRDDSPWYPSLRLFRQEKGRQWEPVIQRVCDALTELLPPTQQMQEAA